jgi:hypothetical protein
VIETSHFYFLIEKATSLEALEVVVCLVTTLPFETTFIVGNSVFNALLAETVLMWLWQPMFVSHLYFLSDQILPLGALVVVVGLNDSLTFRDYLHSRYSVFSVLVGLLLRYHPL